MNKDGNQLSYQRGIFMFSSVLFHVPLHHHVLLSCIKVEHFSGKIKA